MVCCFSHKVLGVSGVRRTQRQPVAGSIHLICDPLNDRPREQTLSRSVEREIDGPLKAVEERRERRDVGGAWNELSTRRR